MNDRYIIELLNMVLNLLETKQTAREKHSGIGYGGL